MAELIMFYNIFLRKLCLNKTENVKYLSIDVYSKKVPLIDILRIMSFLSKHFKISEFGQLYKNFIFFMLKKATKEK